MEIFLILLLFPIFWIIINLIILFLGGWNTLSKNNQYNSTNCQIPIKIFKFQSLYINNITKYRRSVNILIYNDGICLKPLFLIGFMSKPIFISWDKINIEKKINNFFMKNIMFNLDGKRLIIYGESVNYIIEKLNRGF